MWGCGADAPRISRISLPRIPAWPPPARPAALKNISACRCGGWIRNGGQGEPWLGGGRPGQEGSRPSSRCPLQIWAPALHPPRPPARPAARQHTAAGHRRLVRTPPAASTRANMAANGIQYRCAQPGAGPQPAGPRRTAGLRAGRIALPPWLLRAMPLGLPPHATPVPPWPLQRALLRRRLRVQVPAAPPAAAARRAAHVGCLFAAVRRAGHLIAAATPALSLHAGTWCCRRTSPSACRRTGY